MAILDYLKANKNVSFKEKPLNVLDIALITEISYWNLECFLPLPSGFIKLDYFINNKKALVDPSLFVRKNTILYSELLTSERFKDIEIGEFAFENSDDGRFCSMLIRVADYNFIVYRGTDLTIAGWVEDFNMAIFNTIISQRLGVEYTKRIMDKYPGNFYLTGHSKGGNLAIYSAYMLNSNYDERILGIYDFDGPGFKENIIDTPRYSMLRNKIHRYTPQNDIIGCCLNVSVPNVVKSTSISIFQHDMYSWQTNGDDFRYLKRNLYKSQAFGDAVSDWLDSMAYEEKVHFLDIIYGIFKKAKIDSVNQLKQNLFLSINAILKCYSKEEKNQKIFVKKFLFAFAKIYIKYNFYIMNPKGYEEKIARANKRALKEYTISSKEIEKKKKIASVEEV